MGADDPQIDHDLQNVMVPDQEVPIQFCVLEMKKLSIKMPIAELYVNDA